MSHAFADITESTGLYYYMTMKDFEREQAKRNYRRVEDDEKFRIHQQRNIRLQTFFVFQQCKKVISAKKLQLNNYEDLFEFFSTFDLVDFIEPANCVDSYFPCQLIEGNQAWISQSESGHFRYFSKPKMGKTIGFDFLDLLEIHYGIGSHNTLHHAIHDFGISFMEESWVQEQNQKYLANLTLIHQTKRWRVDYPALHEYIGKHMKLLETLNVIGNVQIKKRDFSYREQSLFFASTSYIADFVGTCNLSTTNKVVNLFAVLGLIEKVHESSIPSSLMHESKAIADRRNLGNHISYYIIPPMMDRLDLANQRAQELLRHQIDYFNLTRDRIAFVFGDVFAKSIYVQQIQKNKVKASHIPQNIHHALTERFDQLLTTHGYVTKSMVFEPRIGKTTKMDRRKALEKIWNTLIVSGDFRYIKPSRKLMNQYQLASQEYIVLAGEAKETNEK